MRMGEIVHPLSGASLVECVPSLSIEAITWEHNVLHTQMHECATRMLVAHVCPVRSRDVLHSHHGDVVR